MAPLIITIKKRSTFVYVKNNGRFVRGKAINVQIFEDINLKGIIAVGYTANKRLGNAVKRNKAKRLMRELSKKVLIKYGKINSYYVLIAKTSIFQISFLELELEFKKIIA